MGNAVIFKESLGIFSGFSKIKKLGKQKTIKQRRNSLKLSPLFLSSLWMVSEKNTYILKGDSLVLELSSDFLFIRNMELQLKHLKSAVLLEWTYNEKFCATSSYPEYITFFFGIFCWFCGCRNLSNANFCVRKYFEILPTNTKELNLILKCFLKCSSKENIY